MKKILKNRVYNTDTAVMLAEWDNGYAVSDFNHASETLYRTKAGLFFLHCEGGGLSLYATRVGNSSGWGECITPVTYEKAQNWAEEKLDGDKYEEIFGVPDEGQTEKLHTSILSTTRQKLDKKVARSGETIGEIIDKLVEENL